MSLHIGICVGVNVGVCVGVDVSVGVCATHLVRLHIGICHRCRSM